jgi:chromosome segregation ATPase
MSTVYSTDTITSSADESFIGDQQLHNLLLGFKPSEAQHDASLCPFCDEADDGSASHIDDIPEGGDMSNQTHTDEDFEAVKSELEELKASQEQAAIEARIDELKSEHETALADLQAQLDTAQASLDAKTAQYDELVAFLQEEADRAEAEKQMEARRGEVAERVSEIFSDEEYIAANLDRWVAMSDEALEQNLSDAKAAQQAISSAGSERKPLESSAMQAGLEETAGDKDLSSLRAEVFSPETRRAIRTIGPRY